MDNRSSEGLANFLVAQVSQENLSEDERQEPWLKQLEQQQLQQQEDETDKQEFFASLDNGLDYSAMNRDMTQDSIDEYELANDGSLLLPSISRPIPAQEPLVKHQLSDASLNLVSGSEISNSTISVHAQPPQEDRPPIVPVRKNSTSTRMTSPTVLSATTRSDAAILSRTETPLPTTNVDNDRTKQLLRELEFMQQILADEQKVSKSLKAQLEGVTSENETMKGENRLLNVEVQDLRKRITLLHMNQHPRGTAAKSGPATVGDGMPGDKLKQQEVLEYQRSNERMAAEMKSLKSQLASLEEQRISDKKQYDAIVTALRADLAVTRSSRNPSSSSSTADTQDLLKKLEQVAAEKKWLQEESVKRVQELRDEHVRLSSVNKQQQQTIAQLEQQLSEMKPIGTSAKPSRIPTSASGSHQVKLEEEVLKLERENVRLSEKVASLEMSRDARGEQHEVERMKEECETWKTRCVDLEERLGRMQQQVQQLSQFQSESEHGQLLIHKLEGDLKRAEDHNKQLQAQLDIFAQDSMGPTKKIMYEWLQKLDRLDEQLCRREALWHKLVGQETLAPSSAPRHGSHHNKESQLWEMSRELESLMRMMSEIVKAK